MLNKREKLVMKVIYYEAVKRDDGVGLLAPIDILKRMPYTQEINLDKVDRIIEELALDDYFEVDAVEKKGEKLLCFTLHQKGHAFYREILSEKRAVYRKIYLTIAGVLLSFLLKLIIDAIAK